MEGRRARGGPRGGARGGGGRSPGRDSDHVRNGCGEGGEVQSVEGSGLGSSIVPVGVGGGLMGIRRGALDKRPRNLTPSTLAGLALARRKGCNP